MAFFFRHAKLYLGSLLLFALLLLSPFSTGISSASAPQDNSLFYDSRIEFKRSGCTTVVYQTPEEFINEVVLPSTMTTELTRMQTAIQNGYWAIRSEWSATTVVRFLFDDDPLTNTYPASNAYTYMGATNGNIYRYDYQLTATSCIVERSSTITNGLNMIVSGIASESPRNILNFVGWGNTVSAYPAGYVGNSFVINTTEPTTTGGGGGTEIPEPDSWDTVMQDTMTIVSDKAGLAIKIGLLLGAVNFLLQWLASVLFASRWFRK